MRLLAVLASLALAIYVVGVLFFTVSNISKLIFSFKRHDLGYKFWSRQGIILTWPIALMSEEGRTALPIIWKGDY